MLEEKQIQETAATIIGAGVTGLVCAHSLMSTNSTFFLFESNPEAGGAATTVSLDDFLFDFGVHIFYFQTQEAKDFFKEQLSGEFLEQRKSVSIYTPDAMIPYPYQANLCSLPTDRVVDSLADFFDAQQKAVTPKNFSEWLVSTYGTSIAEDFLIPHNEKLMQTDLEKVSTTWAERYFPKPNGRQIIEGAIRGNSAQFHPNESFLYPNQGGAGKFASELSSGKNIQYNKRLLGVDTARKILSFEDGSVHSYNKLVSTVALPELLMMLTPAPEWRDDVLGRLLYSSLAVVAVGTSQRCQLSEAGTHWLYYPQRNIPFQRLSFMENFSQSNAPDGKSAICMECTLPAGSRPPMNLAKECLDSLNRLGILESEQENIVEVFYDKYGYPIFHEQWQEDMEMVNEYLDQQDISSTGRNGAWKYSNMEEAILWGRQAAVWCRQVNKG